MKKRISLYYNIYVTKKDRVVKHRKKTPKILILDLHIFFALCDLRFKIGLNL